MTDRSAPPPRSEQPEAKPSIAPGDIDVKGVVKNVWLALKLLRDKRVEVWTKLLLLAIPAIHWWFPFDFPGPFDELLVAYSLVLAFIEFAPDDAVRDAQGDLARRKSDEQSPQEEESDVVESQFREEREADSNHVSTKPDDTVDIDWLSKSLPYGMVGGTVATGLIAVSWLLAGVQLTVMQLLGVISESQLAESPWHQVTRFMVNVPELVGLILTSTWVILFLLTTGAAYVWLNARSKRIGEKLN